MSIQLFFIPFFFSVLLMNVFSVLFLVAFLRACVCSLRVVVSMHQHYIQSWKFPFLLFFTHTVCVVSGMEGLKHRFLVLWSICLSSSHVYFKNNPKSLTSGTAQVLIHLMRFLQYNLISSNVLVLLRYSFFFSFFFFHLNLFGVICFQYSQVCVSFFFLWAFWFFFIW